MKLNKLFYLLVAVCAIFTACNDSTTPAQSVKGYLTVIDQSVNFDFYGGNGEVYYVISDGEEGAKPTAKSHVDWINNIVIDDMTITFNVAPNTNTQKRVGTLAVSFGEQSYDVFVGQEGAWKVDFEFTAQAINGQYYGTKFGDPNYLVILSTFGTYGETWRGADTYYRLDMYSTTAAGEVVTLPNGVYVYDMYDMGNGGTFGTEYSWYLDSLGDGSFYESQFQDGVVIVTDNRVEAWLMLAKNGQVHHVVYEGALELGYLEAPKPDHYSSLTGDYTVNEIGGKLRLVNYGDVYEIGANNWSVSMVGSDDYNYPYFMLDVVAETAGTDVDSILGTYTVATENVAKNTFLAGSMNGTQYVGSWFFNVVDGYFGSSDLAPLTGGTITIAKDGNNYVVTYDCQDDNGHKVIGTYSCVEVTDYTNMQ